MQQRCETAHGWEPGETEGRREEDVVQTHLDAVLCSLLWVTLLQQGGWTG